MAMKSIEFEFHPVFKVWRQQCDGLEVEVFDEEFTDLEAAKEAVEDVKEFFNGDRIWIEQHYSTECTGVIDV